MFSTTGTRLGLALLAYMAAVTAVITLAPFHFAWPGAIHLMWYAPVDDVAANVALFVPIGFFLRLARPRPGDRLALGPLAAGLAASAAIEALQVLLPGRFPSPWDVAANGAGAWAGALLHDRVARQVTVDARLVRALAVEHPAVAVVYLLVPLLWLDTLASGDDPARLALALLLGLSGSVIIATMHSRYLRPAALTSRLDTALAAAAWFSIGTAPALLRDARTIALGVMAVAAFTWLAAGERVAEGAERRFELLALRRAAVFFVPYLMLVALWPPFASLLATGWRGTAGLPPVPPEALAHVPILRFVEFLAGATLLGYMLAQARGRREEGWPALLRAAVARGAPLMLLLEGMRGFRPATAASALEAAVAVLAVAYGAGLYFLGRAHVRRLLRERGTAAQPPSAATPATSRSTSASVV